MLLSVSKMFTSDCEKELDIFTKYFQLAWYAVPPYQEPNKHQA